VSVLRFLCSAQLSLIDCVRISCSTAQFGTAHMKAGRLPDRRARERSMTAVSTLGAGNTRSSRLSRIRAMYRAAKRAFVEWNVQRENIRALRTLSDHTLKDIGLHRSELTSITVLKGRDQSRRSRGAFRMFRLRALF